MRRSVMSSDEYRRYGLAAAPSAPARAVKAQGGHVLSLDEPQGWPSTAPSSAGVCVTQESAMKVSAFWACVRLLASTMGSLPMLVYRSVDDVTRTLARDTPLWTVLHDSPNADQTPIDFVEFIALSMILQGNGYARKIKSGSRLIALDPVRPDIMNVRRLPSGAIGYRWSFDGKEYDLTDADVFHVRGFGGGPLGGLSTMTYAREVMGVAQATNAAAAGMFANGMRPSGTLEMDKFLDEQKYQLAEQRIVEKFVGAQNAGRPFILEGGMKWNPLSMNSEDAQLLESRAFSVEEVCRIFGVPPFMIGHSEKSTSWGTGIEQQTLGFQKYTLNPYLRRIEQAVSKQLIDPAERGVLHAEFNLEGLLRADSAGRMNFYRGMTQIGAMTVNEVRRKENLPPIEGGDVARVQAQNVPLTEAGNGIGSGNDNAN
jgi:HK97 family phage portal protein